MPVAGKSLLDPLSSLPLLYLVSPVTPCSWHNLDPIVSLMLLECNNRYMPDYPALPTPSQYKSLNQGQQWSGGLGRSNPQLCNIRDVVHDICSPIIGVCITPKSCSLLASCHTLSDQFCTYAKTNNVSSPWKPKCHSPANWACHLLHQLHIINSSLWPFREHFRQSYPACCLWLPISCIAPSSRISLCNLYQLCVTMI